MEGLDEVVVSAVSRFVSRGPMFFKCKMLRESGPHIPLFLQLLIALVYDSASSMKSACPS